MNFSTVGKFIGGLALVAIAVGGLLLWHMVGSTTYFVCHGETTINRSNDPRPVQHVSAEITLTPAFNRWLFGADDYGEFAVDSYRERWRINYVTRSFLLLRGEGLRRGHFDLVSRRLIANTGEMEYNLICEEAQRVRL